MKRSFDNMEHETFKGMKMETHPLGDWIFTQVPSSPSCIINFEEELTPLPSPFNEVAYCQTQSFTSTCQVLPSDAIVFEKSTNVGTKKRAPTKRYSARDENSKKIVTELTQLSFATSRCNIMLLSPQRNLRNGLVIKNVDIIESHYKQKHLGIGSGTESAYKYYLHILFEIKQLLTPKLTLLNFDDGKLLDKYLNVHSAILSDNGLIGIYLISFSINSYHLASSRINEKGKVKLLCNDLSSAPFKLYSRRTDNCIFYSAKLAPIVEDEEDPLSPVDNEFYFAEF